MTGCGGADMIRKTKGNPFFYISLATYFSSTTAEHAACARTTGCDLRTRQFPPLHTRLALGCRPAKKNST